MVSGPRAGIHLGFDPLGEKVWAVLIQTSLKAAEHGDPLLPVLVFRLLQYYFLLSKQKVLARLQPVQNSAAGVLICTNTRTRHPHVKVS